MPDVEVILLLLGPPASPSSIGMMQLSELSIEMGLYVKISTNPLELARVRSANRATVVIVSEYLEGDYDVFALISVLRCARNVGVILLSDHHSDSHRLAFRAGAHACLPSGVAPEAFRATVRHVARQCAPAHDGLALRERVRVSYFEPSQACIERLSSVQAADVCGAAGLHAADFAHREEGSPGTNGVNDMSGVAMTRRVSATYGEDGPRSFHGANGLGPSRAVECSPDSDTLASAPNVWRLASRGWQLNTPDGLVIELTATERLILSRLFEAKRETVGYADLLAQHGSQGAQVHSIPLLAGAISRLRRKCERRGVVLPILAFRSKGYRFAADGVVG